MKKLHNPWITLDEWLDWYQRILAECEFDAESDLRSAIILNSIVKDRCLNLLDIKDMFLDKIHAVFGAGPSLELDIRKFLKYERHNALLKIAADGATVALLKNNLVPDIIVTDLDGSLNALLKANELGSILVIHAHGDNIDLLMQFLPMVKGRFLATTQAEPFGCLYNFGGFTDGDRAVFLSSSLNAKAIVLLGMDFGNTIGPYSKPDVYLDYKKRELKLKKLRIGKSLIEWLASKISIPIYNMTSFGLDIIGTYRIELLDEVF